MQVSAEVAATLLDQNPAAHLMHDEEPLLLVQEPAGQAIHGFAVLVAPITDENVPTGHSVQTALVVAPTIDDHVPAAQVAQDDEPNEDHVPALQMTQMAVVAIIAAGPEMEDHIPALHALQEGPKNPPAQPDPATT